jgi:hypothetical protein
MMGSLNEMPFRRDELASRPYTDDEDAYLRAHPSREEREEVARHLGRSAGAVTQQLSKLGVIGRPGLYGRPPTWSTGTGPKPRPEARNNQPPPNPLDRVGRPAWFALEGGESSVEFARRLTRGR